MIRYDRHRRTSIQPQEHQIFNSSRQWGGSHSPRSPSLIFHSCFRKPVFKSSISYGIYWTGIYTAKWGRIRQTNGESKEEVSEDCLMSNIISSVNILPLGKLTLFTEHRRMIIFHNGSLSSAQLLTRMHHDVSVSGSHERTPWMNLWLRSFGKSS